MGEIHVIVADGSGESGTDAQSVHRYQSAWMAHWKHTSYKSAAIDCKFKREGKQISVAEKHNLVGQSDVPVDISTSAEAFRETNRAAKVTFMYGSITTSPEKLKKEGLNFKSFPIFSISPKRNGTLSLKREQYAVYHREFSKSQTDAGFGGNSLQFDRNGNHLPSTSAHIPPKSLTSSRECRLLSEGLYPADLIMKSPYFIEKDKFAVSKSLWNDFVKPTSDLVARGYNRGKTSLPSFVCQTSYNLASREQIRNTYYDSHSSLFIHEKKKSSLSDAQRSWFSRLMHSGPLLLPLASSDDRLDPVCDQHRNMQNDSGMGRLSGHSIPFQTTQDENSYHGSSSVPQLPYSVHDVETMKIYTTIDSVEETSRGHPKISQTTHHFLMSKKTDINLSDGCQFFRESITPAKFRRNAFDEISDFSPPLHYRALEGVKLTALGSSMENEGKENFQDFKTPIDLRNESSAETNIMDINALPENHVSGDVPLTSIRFPKARQKSLTYEVAVPSAREKKKGKLVNSVLLDINKEPPEIDALTSPVDDRETSTSRTQSLDVEHLFHANSKAGNYGNGSLGPEPGSRWIKRLKLSTAEAAYGTKSSTIGETSSHEKANKIFGKMMKGSKSSSEPKSICHLEELMIAEFPATVSRNGKSSFVKAIQTVQVILSDPWIRRWSHIRAALTKEEHESMELRQPQASFAIAEGLKEKQFPSIAAMALMGKSMCSYHPCEFLKKGSLVVWNTKG